MTISNQQIRANYTGDNSSTSFPIPFPFYLATDIDVLLAGVTQTSGYTISGGVDASGNPQPGTCVFASAPATATPVLLLLNVPLTQLVQLVDGTAFQSATLNQVNDRAVQALLRVQDLLSRAIVAPDGDVSPGMSLPPAASRAGLFLTFDGAGNLLLASAGPGTNNTQSTLGPVVNPLSTSENSQGLIPVPANQVYPVLDSRRYALDTTGSADVTVTLQKILDTAGAAALDGQVRIVVLQPGTYKVRRLYMHYSNVWLCLMPGATIIQTLTGITNNNTAGVAPAYAVIHINPLNYLSGPSSGSAGQITNVKIYGGGTVQGPNTVSPGSYQPFQLGIVANDCTNCVVEGITIQGCGGESLLMGNSSWFTNANFQMTRCEILQGGEMGFNNARVALAADNYIHDVWFQNGLSIDADNFIIRNNRIRNMPNSGINFGGSGARDINACRAGLVTGNVLSSTGQANIGAYAIFATDDGATTVPKNNIHICDNLIEGHIGPAAIAGDYNSGLVFVDNNTVVDCVYSGSGVAFNVIAGSATWHLKGNTFTPGPSGNYAYGVSNGSTTASVFIEESNKIYGHPTADINFGAAIKNMGQISLPLSGISGTPNTTITWARSLMTVTLRFSPATGASSGTSMGLSGLPAQACPASATLLLPIALEDNSVNVNGYLQITAAGVITFYPSVAFNSAGFTNGGTKGIPQPVCVPFAVN